VAAAYRLQRIGPLRAALYGGLAGGVIGFLPAIAAVVVIFILAAAQDYSQSGAPVWPALAALGGNLVFCAALGFVIAGGFALAYNLLHARTGTAIIHFERS
jgi:uncharacterized protein YqgC (DUF456 family)